MAQFAARLAQVLCAFMFLDTTHSNKHLSASHCFGPSNDARAYCNVGETWVRPGSWPTMHAPCVR